MKSQLPDTRKCQTTSNDREKAGDAGVYILLYGGRSITGLAGMAGKENQAAEQTAWSLSWS